MWLFIRRLCLAVGAGIALEISFPQPGIWPLSFVGVALLTWALIGARLYEALLFGLISGAILWLGLIRWLTLYLGPVPWLALGILQTLFFTAGTVLLWFIINRLHARIHNQNLRVLIVSLLGAAAWATRELMTSSWPYGGFSWARLAQSQSESPFRFLVAWGGTAFLSFIVAFFSIALVEILRYRRSTRLSASIWIVVVLACCFVPPPALVPAGTASVLAVQGNSKAGLFDNRTSGQILSDHVSGTLQYQGRDIDMIVWPENATDVSPLENAISAQVLTTVSTKLDAPIVTGAIVRDPDDSWFNSSLVWDGQRGLASRYDKMHPVPFAEYMPDRSFWRQFAPDLIDLVGYDYRAGNRSPVVDVSGIPTGITICFDITSGQQLRQISVEGAQLILAQTNNADFGKTDENLQQLAITRLAAIELGKAIVNISTVGTSAILSPTGETLDYIPAYEPGAMLSNVPLTTGNTPATYVAPMTELLLILLTGGGLLYCIRWRRRA